MPLLTALRRRWWVVVGVVLVVLVFSASTIASFWTDLLWFDSVGFGAVFTRRLAVQSALAGGGTVLVALVVAGNLAIARRLAPEFRLTTEAEQVVERYRDLLLTFYRPALVAVALVAGLFLGTGLAGAWDVFLLGTNAVPFGQPDPQFGRDLGFFVFRLPLYQLVNAWLFGLVAFVIVLTAGAHYVLGGIRPQSPGQKITAGATAQLSVLLAALVAIRGWGFWLDRYELSYSTRGRVTGLSYTDVTAQLRAFELLTLIAGVCVVLFLVNLWVRNFLLPAAGVSILVVAALVLSGAYPAAVQFFRVRPDELTLERPYIGRNLTCTRFGYDITLEGDVGDDEGNTDDERACSGSADDATVEVSSYPARPSIPTDALATAGPSLDATRLWDPAVLDPVYGQLQALRQFFTFTDVDADRYQIDGEQQEVNVALRELNETNLPEENWLNRRLIYTHGYGLVASDVNAKTDQGAPIFLAQDIPQQSDEAFELDQPRVYFGESPPAYSVVDTGQPELDFAGGTDDEAFSYDGADGVGIGDPLRRLAFALRFSDVNLLLSGLLRSDSKVLYNRNVRERVQRVAPYLQFDGDPYPVAADGSIQWVLDGYTTSAMLPYSQRVDLEGLTGAPQRELVPVQAANGAVTFQEQLVQVSSLRGSANYIRNSVKAVVDAYDGTVTLYVVDEEDPILATWRAIFPGSFTDVAEAPEALVAHFRYPEDLMRVQSSLLETYHVDDVAVFFRGDDRWRIPDDAAAGQNNADESSPLPLRPNYLQLRLPGEEEEEFALVQPFNANERENLVGLAAARSDPGAYGQMRLYELPVEQNVRGPAQVQARIESDEAVSEFTTLLGQQGSRVIRGNLLSLPLGDGLLYAEPLFVASESVSIPELRQVVLVLGDQVVMRETLRDALVALLGDEAGAVIDQPEGATVSVEGETPPSPSPGAPSSATPAPSASAGGTPAPTAPAGTPGPQAGVPELVDAALQALADADTALAEGDLGGYQAKIDEAEALLQRAQQAGQGG